MRSMTNIPLDKSWVIRCLCLDIIHGYKDGPLILKPHKRSDDIEHALNALGKWKTTDTVYVGESATLLRFLKFISWKQKWNTKFIPSGSLTKRKICDDPAIVDYSFEQLLQLDGGTSQWASIAYLCGKRDGLPADLPYKLKVTILACNHWEKQREKTASWEARFDPTIWGQVKCFENLCAGLPPEWEPIQSEDYCFARAFNLITEEEGLKRWPTLLNHETNRIDEMETAINAFKYSRVVCSVDHRVTQAMVLKAIHDKIPYTCWLPKSVNKSWPEFWDFVKGL